MSYHISGLGHAPNYQANVLYRGAPIAGLGVAPNYQSNVRYRGVPFHGLSGDEKKTALATAKLVNIATSQGNTAAAQQIQSAAAAVLPAQIAWDAAASKMRAAGAKAISILPTQAQPSARNALEQSIVQALGPRPSAAMPVLAAGGVPKFGGAAVGPGVPLSGGNNTMLIVGGAAALLAVVMLMKR